MTKELDIVVADEEEGTSEVTLNGKRIGAIHFLSSDTFLDEDEDEDDEDFDYVEDDNTDSDDEDGDSDDVEDGDDEDSDSDDVEDGDDEDNDSDLFDDLSSIPNPPKYAFVWELPELIDAMRPLGGNTREEVTELLRGLIQEFQLLLETKDANV